MILIYVGAGGFLGSCARYLLTIMCRNMSVDFPLGTLLSNAAAGLLIGFIIGIDRQADIIPPHAKLFLTTGLLGGLSTFSSFSLETVDLFSSGRYFICFLNVLLNLSLSLLGVVLGLAAASLVLSRAG